MKLIEITWSDAWSSSDYYKEGEDNTSFNMKDVGYLCEDNGDCVVIASCWCTDDDRLRHVKGIPWVNILKYEELV